MGRKFTVDDIDAVFDTTENIVQQGHAIASDIATGVREINNIIKNDNNGGCCNCGGMHQPQHDPRSRRYIQPNMNTGYYQQPQPGFYNGPQPQQQNQYYNPSSVPYGWSDNSKSSRSMMNGSSRYGYDNNYQYNTNPYNQQNYQGYGYGYNNSGYGFNNYSGGFSYNPNNNGAKRYGEVTGYESETYGKG